MANNVLSSQGVTVSIKVGTGTATFIGGITDFNLGGGSANVNDITDLNSASKEKLIGVPDEGQFKCSYNLIKNDAGQLALDTARTARTLSELKVITASVTYTMSGYVLTVEKNGAVDTQMTGSSTFEITGSVIQTPTAP